MTGRHDPLNDLVSRVLAAGLAASLGAMSLGLALSVLRGAPDYPAAVPLSELASALKVLDPNACMSLGIVLLLATPAVRVLVLLVGFLRKRDWAFAGIAAAVFLTLLLSLRLGSGR